MKNILKSLFIIWIIFWPITAFWWSYPLKQVSKVECKFTDWNTHSSDCKQDLPIIKWAEYDKYKKDLNYRLIYSVLWWSTYKNGWDVWYWSHLWTDFATAKWTPVYAAWDWTVTIAKTSSWRGNVVVIKHKFNWGYIYTVYAHLDKITTKVWDTIKEWEKIWEVGKTWNSTGNHLHFQIDINEKWSHPYYYSKCSWAIDWVVNSWSCRDLVLANTIDPIHFLESNWADLKLNSDIKKENEKQQEKDRINPNEIANREELEKYELELFLRRYQLTTKSQIPMNVINLGQSWIISVWAATKSDRFRFDWQLPKDIQVVFDPKMVYIIPDKIKYITMWDRPINIKWLKTWTTTITFKMWEAILGSYTIRIKDKNTVIDPQNSILQIIETPFIGSQAWWIAIMKDENFVDILDTAFKGSYKIKTTEFTMLCPIRIKSFEDISYISSYQCPDYELTKEINFWYNDTFKWILLFKIVPTTRERINLRLYKNWKDFNVSLPKNSAYPKDLNKNDAYYDYITTALEKWILTNLKNGYFAPDFDMTQANAVTWIKKTFPEYKDKIIATDRYKNITRLEFLKLISDITWKKSINTNLAFWDSKKETVQYTNLLLDYNTKFLDQYWSNYIQPNKIITRKEAAYILYKMKYPK